MNILSMNKTTFQFIICHKCHRPNIIIYVGGLNKSGNIRIPLIDFKYTLKHTLSTTKIRFRLFPVKYNIVRTTDTKIQVHRK